jgi:hypothetical protein
VVALLLPLLVAGVALVLPLLQWAAHQHQQVGRCYQCWGAQAPLGLLALVAQPLHQQPPQQLLVLEWSWRFAPMLLQPAACRCQMRGHCLSQGLWWWRAARSLAHTPDGCCRQCCQHSGMMPKMTALLLLL